MSEALRGAQVGRTGTRVAGSLRTAGRDDVLGQNLQHRWPVVLPVVHPVMRPAIVDPPLDAILASERPDPPFDDPILQRMEGDDTQSAARPQAVSRHREK